MTLILSWLGINVLFVAWRAGFYKTRIFIRASLTRFVRWVRNDSN